MINQKIKTKTILSKLNDLKTNLYTGKLEIQSENGQNWCIYFRLGRLIWCQGGNNENERWKRYLNQYCPQLETSYLEREATTQYDILAELYQRKQLDKETIVVIIEAIAKEVIFDILQCSQTEQILEKQTPNEIPKLLLGLIQFDLILDSAYTQWQKWEEKKLSKYSPNLYPIIQKKQGINQKLDSLIDGTQTLRGLAQKINQDVVAFTSKIIPLVEEGIIALSDSPNLPVTNHSNKKLIACIDDSVAVCKQLQATLTQWGYDVKIFESSIEATSQLLKNPPDLILLDVIMPVINGYELCTQMRRAPKLKTVPIVFLTGKDGWVDRAKAKMCGATDFLSKPIQKEILLKTINQYVSVNK